MPDLAPTCRPFSVQRAACTTCWMQFSGCVQRQIYRPLSRERLAQDVRRYSMTARLVTRRTPVCRLAMANMLTPAAVSRRAALVPAAEHKDAVKCRATHAASSHSRHDFGFGLRSILCPSPEHRKTSFSLVFFLIGRPIELGLACSDRRPAGSTRETPTSAPTSPVGLALAQAEQRVDAAVWHS